MKKLAEILNQSEFTYNGRIFKDLQRLVYLYNNFSKKHQIETSNDLLLVLDEINNTIDVKGADGYIQHEMHSLETKSKNPELIGFEVTSGYFYNEETEEEICNDDVVEFM